MFIPSNLQWMYITLQHDVNVHRDDAWFRPITCWGFQAPLSVFTISYEFVHFVHVVPLFANMCTLVTDNCRKRHFLLWCRLCFSLLLVTSCARGWNKYPFQWPPDFIIASRFYHWIFVRRIHRPHKSYPPEIWRIDTQPSHIIEGRYIFKTIMLGIYVKFRECIFRVGRNKKINWVEVPMSIHAKGGQMTTPKSLIAFLCMWQSWRFIPSRFSTFMTSLKTNPNTAIRNFRRERDQTLQEFHHWTIGIDTSHDGSMGRTVYLPKYVKTIKINHSWIGINMRCVRPMEIVIFQSPNQKSEMFGVFGAENGSR